MIDWWLNPWSSKAATNSILQNGPRWQILTEQSSIGILVLVCFAKSDTDGVFCGVTSRLPAFKSHRNTLTRSFPFTAEFYLKNRAARVGESSPQFYEDKRAREEPWVSQTPPRCGKSSLKGIFFHNIPIFSLEKTAEFGGEIYCLIRTLRF
jgi:hypothetical protein